MVPFDARECSYAYDDEMSPTVEEEISTISHGDGPMAAQLVLDRPLRGIVVVPDTMCAKTGFVAFCPSPSRTPLARALAC